MRSGVPHKFLDIRDEEGKSINTCKMWFTVSVPIQCGAVFVV